ncbi:MAG: AMP-binding protein [Candidatus Eremiobacteraeota bacterium]|nr:AMP-binding protein [Candidatus Eremiobacteraeota bacterium]
MRSNRSSSRNSSWSSDVSSRATAHVDRFAEDRLPRPERMPALLLEGLEYPKKLNAAAQLLDRRASAGAARRCILAPGAEPWTYGRLLDEANRIAGVLVDELALEPGNRVLLRAPNTPMLAACWFAVLKAGGVAVTTMPLYRAGELRFMMEKAQVKHALCDARLREELQRACEHHGGVRVAYFGGDAPGSMSLEALMSGKPERFENVATSAEDVALIAFTSGTTGAPKAAMHYHRDVLAVCDTYCARVLQPHGDDLFCGSPPLGFTFGLGGLLLFPLYAGAATLLLEKAGPAELLAAIEEYRVTTLFTAPLAYRAMAAGVAGRDVSALRSCVSAGEALPKAVWQEWHAKTGLRILDGIGSTEMLHIFVGSPEAEARAGSTGRAVPGYVAEIHDEAGNRAPDGVVGRLAVRGPTGCKYLQDERQELYVQNGWNYPGDAYRRDADGYFWYVARVDDMIVSAGYNISGPEVEQALIAHADVKEVAVVGKRDAQKETNYVKAFVVLVDGCAGGDAKIEELREFCKSQIAPFKAPREIEFVATLPRTQTGKLQRYKLRDPS